MGFTLVNDVTATVATQSNSGTTSLTVGSGQGASFASATTANPIRIGVFDSTGVLKFYADVTARSTDTLTLANRGAESTADANILTTDLIAAVMTTSVINTLPLGLGVYGDGSDGTVTFDGTTTILGLAPSGSVYTLTRDIWLAAGTINSGVVINTVGWRIFCQGTLTNNGSIRNDGDTAAGANAGATLSGTVAGGGGGGAGNSTAGGTSSSLTASLGGRGGSGGAGTNAAGSSGTVTAPSATQQNVRNVVNAVLGMTFTPTATLTMIRGGSGGGGGGGDGTNNGGGGGGGAGYMLVAARAFAGTGAIRARGGTGGTRSTGNVGGGGGGGGGVVVVISGSVSGGAIAGQTIDANGGTGSSGVGTGTAGATGGNGTVILIPN